MLMIVPEVAWDLVEITTTPLTIIYPKAKNLAKNLIAEDGSIGIRFTQEDFTRQLIQRFRKPMVSTSANISGEKSPAFFEEISEEIKKRLIILYNIGRMIKLHRNHRALLNLVQVEELTL